MASSISYTAIILPSLHEEIGQQYTRLVHILRLRHVLFSSLILARTKPAEPNYYYKIISIVSAIMLIAENNKSFNYKVDCVDEYNQLVTLLAKSNVNIQKWFEDYQHLILLDISKWEITAELSNINDKPMVTITFGIDPSYYYITHLSRYINPGTLYFDPANKLPKGVEVKLTLAKYQSLLEQATIGSTIASIPVNQRGLVEIIRLILRYNSVLFDSGHFISACHDVWVYIRNQLTGRNGVELIEGFACPFNNNLPRFCSLYPQDRVFGAVGSFFALDLTSLSSNGTNKIVMTINPPFVESIMLMTGDKINYWLQHIPNFTAVLLWPYWSGQAGTGYYDEPALSAFLDPNYPYLKWSKVLRKFKYDIWLPLSEETASANFDCILLLVTNDSTCPIDATIVDRLSSSR